jgi:hypothetical protein
LKGWVQEAQSSRPDRAKKSERYKNKLKAKGLEAFIQVVEHLFSKCEILNLIPSTTQKKKRKERKKAPCA